MTTTERAHVTPTIGGQELREIDPRTLLVDLNVRHASTADADLIASVAEHGVLVPIVGVRTEDGRVRVRMGHRRTLAAIEADCATVPVVVVADDESTDDAGTVHRLILQWAENEHRAGLTNAEVAGELFISPRTVNWHLGSVYRKLGFHSRTEATRFAVEHDLL